MFNPNYNSHCISYANQTREWMSTDSKDLYVINLREKYKLLEFNNWINNPFTYKFNSHGFRCDEFKDNPKIMFLGCSNTFGVGLPIDSTWPDIVSKTLGMRYANLSVGGGSNDTAFRMCYGWIDKIKPDIVILLEPPGIRFELVDTLSTKLVSFSSPDTDNLNAFFMKKWGLDDNNAYFNALKNHLAIKQICHSRDIKFIMFDNTEFTRNHPKDDFARDLYHYGKKTNQQFAEYVLTQLDGAASRDRT